MKNLTLLLFLNASLASAFTLNPQYLSGKEVCEKYKPSRSGEISHYVEVPADYQRPDGEKAFIYTYTKKEFNPDLPSVIFFTGGPGVSPRTTEFPLPNTNVIFFEQRGVACSRPPTRELFLNPHFYSSENTARDARAVIESYHITSLAVFGQSYGTVPATIFASLFPQETKTLILEGVIYDGRAMWNPPTKAKLLQELFEHLSLDKQSRILKLTAPQGPLPISWFSRLSEIIFYIDGGVDVFDTFFNNIMAMDDESFIAFVSNYFPPETNESEFDFGDVMMGMIGCQELSMAHPTSSKNLIFKEGEREGKLEYEKNNSKFYDEFCKPLGLKDPSTFYQASKYPVQSPTFYLLGEHDGATDIGQGILHYEHIPQNQKTLLTMTKGGHLPSLGLLKNNYKCDPQTSSDGCHSLDQNVLMAHIFEKIVREQVVSPQDLAAFNRVGPLHWNLK